MSHTVDMVKLLLILLRTLVLVVSFLHVVGCASTTTFDVKSDPLQADVSIVDDKGEKKPLGKTPLTLTEPEIKKAAGDNISAGEFFTVLVEKPGFVSQSFSVPASSFGTTLTALNVKMKEGETQQEIRLAKEIIDHLFLAQKLALAQQFERAQIELDNIIKPFPNFSRALSMRASIYYAQKNYPESTKWYEAAIKADPGMDEAVKMLAKLKQIPGSAAKTDSQNNDKKGSGQ